MITKGEAKKKIKELIDLYEQYKKSPKIMGNEQQICDSLIRPFFRDILGWNIEDPYEFKSQYNMNGKRMDYLVCVEDVSQFIVEAKAPTVEIKSNTHFYNQAVQYAEAKGKDFAILTNFKTFIILRAGIETKGILANEITQIDLSNLSDVGLDFLLYFSKEFWIEQGESNPLYSVKNLKKKRSLDEILVEQMSKWRSYLLGSLKALSENRYNFEDEKDLEYIEEEIQRFVDRLIFICYCEDKQLNDNELKPLFQEYKRKHVGKKTFIINEIRKLFEKYYKIYDSDLFKKGICDDFDFDDSILGEMLEDLRGYYEGLPYDFSVIDADILGRAYENFLGHITTGKVRFKEKKDSGKRKKMGIYYTPQYIVNYIVKNTVREKIKNLNFDEILKIKIVDPACGSGSFLIKAFDVLVEESKIRLKRDLNYEEKEKLLLNCIHGVDLDERACDIVKLNLSLKLAERGKKLPMLHKNIMNGNSLIDDPEIAQNKALNWGEKFPFKFDIVIGNPPYVGYKGHLEIFEKIQKTKFGKDFHNKEMDLWYYFVHRGLDILEENGLFSFITTKYWFTAYGAKKLREDINKRSKILQLIDFGDHIIFGSAKGQHNSIFLLQKNNHNKENKVKLIDFSEKSIKINDKIIDQAFINNHTFICLQKEIFEEKSGNIIFSIKKSKELGNIEKDSKLLEIFCKIFSGIKTGADKVFIFDDKDVHSLNLTVKSKQLYLKNFYKNSDINRYYLKVPSKKILLVKNNEDLKSVDVHNYLSDYKDILYKRKARFGVMKNRLDLNQSDNFLKNFDREKIVVPYRNKSLSFTLSEKEFYSAEDIYYIIINDDYLNKINIKSLLAILNSKVIRYWYSIKGKGKGSIFEFTSAPLRKIPIRFPTSPQESKIILLVDKMLKFQKEYHNENILRKDKIEEDIEKIDEQINEIVYKLYDLTPEEIKIVEESLK